MFVEAVVESSRCPPRLTPDRPMTHARPLTVALLAALPAVPAAGAFVIDVDYSGNAAFQQTFEDAADVWESKLSGYQNGTAVNRSAGSSYQIGDTVETLFITAQVDSIDGPGGTLGFAGPDELVLDAQGFLLATDGGMTFDADDFASGPTAAFFDVVLHEMAHVMGFGTLWGSNGVYTNGSGEYGGVNANALWAAEFGQSGTSDVELSGGSGTANGHWNENFQGNGLTGIVGVDPARASFGRDMRDELMTGWLNPNPFISDMTVASFVDIGFVATPIPSPSAVFGTVVGLAAITLRRRTRA